MKFLLIILFVYAAVLSLPSYGEIRAWTSKSGQTVEASLVRQDAFSVKLKTPDGGVLSIPPSQLSDKDRRYLAGVRTLDKYVNADDGSIIFEKHGLKLICTEHGGLHMIAEDQRPHHRTSVWGHASPEELMTVLRKSLDWFAKAEETGALVDFKELLDKRKPGNFGRREGIQIGFSSVDASEPMSLKPVQDTYITFAIYNDREDYVRRVTTDFRKQEVEMMLHTLEGVPFGLIREVAKQRRKAAKEVFN